MATVRVSHGIDDLRNDLEIIPELMVKRGHDVVKRDIREGRTLARANARRNSPRHGKHYDDAITDEMTGALSGEYGPDASMPQGGMLFEYGEGRQSAPHLNITKSFDVIAPKFVSDVGAMVEGLFWP